MYLLAVSNYFSSLLKMGLLSEKTRFPSMFNLPFKPLNILMLTKFKYSVNIWQQIPSTLGGPTIYSWRSTQSETEIMLYNHIYLAWFKKKIFFYFYSYLLTNLSTATTYYKRIHIEESKWMLLYTAQPTACWWILWICL